jgi:ATP-dependent Clp protease ATP-binding subunit ClpB
MLADRKLFISLSPSAQNYLAEVGFDPVYGARPLKRAIQRELQNPLATKILENTFVEGDTILVDCIDNALVFQKKDVNDEGAIARSLNFALSASQVVSPE